MRKKSNRVCQIMVEMYKIMRYNQENSKSTPEEMGYVNYMKQFCVAPVGLGRQAGHTTAAVQIHKACPNLNIVTLMKTPQSTNPIRDICEKENVPYTTDKFKYFHNNFSGQLPSYPDLIVIDGMGLLTLGETVPKIQEMVVGMPIVMVLQPKIG